MNGFKFGNVDSRNYGAYVFRKSTYAAPAQEYIVQTIPGKNGSLLMRNNRYPDVPIAFSVIIPEHYSTRYPALVNDLLSQSGYQRLEYSEDIDEPDFFFYQAYLDSNIEIVSDSKNGMGKFELVFMRKAQKFLESGELPIVVTEDRTITNPTRFNASPMLRIYGVGQVGINDSTITILQSDEYTDIDCEIGEAYHDSAAYPKNQYVQLSGIDYPKLVPGANNITLGIGITSVKVVPRWWQL